MDSMIPSARDQRRDAIVAVARAAFFKNGFAGTAMSSIAAELGGSKTTLWAYFPSKQDLFAAVFDELAERFGGALTVSLADTNEMTGTLLRFATAMMTAALTPDIVELHRIIAGESGRFPELGQLFYERGPGRGHARLADYFGRAMGAGHMREVDPFVAARHFMAMCQSGRFQRAMYALEPLPGRDTINAEVDDAVSAFVRAYAP